jgi:hypothetical protein
LGVGDASASLVENRSEGRSNVFLAARLDGGGASTAVRIRNISARGALVDGRTLPPVGTPVRLTRGRFSAVGQLAWAGEGQAGVNFDCEIDVPSWVQRVGHGGQQRVDGVIAALRSGVRPPEAHHGGADLSLGEISAALDETCERLAQTPIMSIAFGEELIKLDSLAQSLRRLATGDPNRRVKQP